MARAITKVFGSKSVEMTIRRIADGKMVSETYTFQGCKSKRAAEIALKKELKTDNFIIVSSEVVDGGSETKYTMDADTFFILSEYCEDDTVYGHDTVTATFKVTKTTYYTADSMEPQTYYYVGVTTERKLRKAIADAIKDTNILVANTEVVKKRKFMSKDAFIERATVVEN